MNILPSETKDFLNKKYWDKFFRKLKEKGEDSEFFEWYGDFKNFSPILSKIIKTSDKIINIGCGKSLFSEDMYDDGYTNQLNVDYSEEVIQDMQKRSEGIRPNIQYAVADIFNMVYTDKEFDVTLDKGCLDAVYPEVTEEITSQVRKLFEHIIRIGSKRYTLVSLLQDHIIEEILEYFGKEKGFKITIYEVLIQKSKQFPFLVDIEFEKNTSNTVTLALKNQDTVVLSFDECKAQIKKVQLQNHFMTQVKKVRQGQRFTIDLWDASNQVTPKYSLKIVDSQSKKLLDQKTCGCFITSQGKETGYLYATEKGNFDILDQTGLSRLIIAILNPGFVFESLKQVQDELSPVMDDLMPKNCSNVPVPFMADGDEIGQKNIIVQDDDVIVEEIVIEEEIFRRLIIKNNFNQIQSQFKLGYYSEKNQEKQYLKESLIKETLLPSKKGMIIGINDSYLDFEAHRGILAGLALFPIQEVKKKEFKISILGGGLGGLGKFFYTHFPNMYVSNVEISKSIVDISKKYFEVQENERFSMVCNDALKYIDKKYKSQQKNKKKKGQNKEGEEEEQKKDEQQQQDKQEEQKSEEQSLEVGNPNGTDYIIIDINGKQGETSPPKPFLEIDFLKKLQSQLKSHTGVLAINVVAFGEKEIKGIIEKLNQVFDIIYSLKTESELNEVLFCVNHKFRRDIRNQEEIILVESQYTPDKKALEASFKSIQKARVKNWEQTLNIEETLRNLKLKIPKITGNPFERTKYHVLGEDNQETKNLTKEQYQKDLGCITKQQQKKKQKNRKK